MRAAAPDCGLAAVGVGATLVLGAKSARPFRRYLILVLIAAAAFIAVGVLRWPLVPVVLVAVPVSFLFSFYAERGRTRAG